MSSDSEAELRARLEVRKKRRCGSGGQFLGSGRFLGSGGDGGGGDGSDQRGDGEGGNSEGGNVEGGNGGCSSRGKGHVCSGSDNRLRQFLDLARPRPAAGRAQPVQPVKVNGPRPRPAGFMMSPQGQIDEAGPRSAPGWVTILEPEIRKLKARFTLLSPLRIHTGCTGIGAPTSALEAGGGSKSHNQAVCTTSQASKVICVE